jgi:hypothetical protein
MKDGYIEDIEMFRATNSVEVVYLLINTVGNRVSFCQTPQSRGVSCACRSWPYTLKGRNCPEVFFQWLLDLVCSRYILQPDPKTMPVFRQLRYS